MHDLIDSQRPQHQDLRQRVLRLEIRQHFLLTFLHLALQHLLGVELSVPLSAHVTRYLLLLHLGDDLFLLDHPADHVLPPLFRPAILPRASLWAVVAVVEEILDGADEQPNLPLVEEDQEWTGTHINVDLHVIDEPHLDQHKEVHAFEDVELLEVFDHACFLLLR
jgi:hypothetical protein